MPIAVKELSLGNILSFGPQKLNIGLGSLNVLIGPNGSGNRILLRYLPFCARALPICELLFAKTAG